jgi:hypothetical protein
MAKPRAIEPLALTAAILAAGTAVIYVWSMRDQGSQPYAWVIGILAGGGLLAGYGTLWKLPYRRAVLVICGGALILAAQALSSQLRVLPECICVNLSLTGHKLNYNGEDADLDGRGGNFGITDNLAAW